MTKTKKWTWGRREAVEDVVQIDDESGHEWWASRDQLDTPINRRWRKPRPGGQYPFRRSSDRTTHGRQADGTPRTASPFFAPSEDDPVTKVDWSTDALFTAPTEPAFAPTESLFAPADEPAFGQADEPPSPAVDGASPWTELGLTSDASWDDVVQRHRELAKEHHPDRHSLSPGDAKRVAEVRMAAINAAFADLDRIYRLTDER
jgi:hypothetical protein